MTVAELIAELERFPGDAWVCSDGQDGGIAKVILMEHVGEYEDTVVIVAGAD